MCEPQAAAGGPLCPESRRFGDYELLEEIARGGMGVVYKARQGHPSRLVALKMILAGPFARGAEIKRFQTEAEAAANLNHPNIVGIHEVGVTEGQHYFSMHYIEGPSLAQLDPQKHWWADGGKAAAHMLTKVARALAYAHEHGILHRDLKPANILLDAHGEPHVSDFGLARRMGADSSLTLEGAVLGTPSFMAPEQAAGKNRDLGVAADIYSLGAILYYLLTGRPPFAAASPLDTLVQVLEGEVIVPRLINPRVARDLERICLRCLEKVPERRYPTAAALAEDLDRFVQGEPVRAQPRGTMPLLIHWIRHQPALALRLVGLAICVTIAQLTWHYQPTATPTQHARIVSALIAWALLSCLCQWGLQRAHWRDWVPFVWAGVDTFCLTAVLWFEQTLPGPLLASYFALVALSGLWFRPSLVGLTALLSVFGYGVQVLGEHLRQGQVEKPNWHIAFLVLLVLTGIAVAYQVHRIRALSRFYDRQSP